MKPSRKRTYDGAVKALGERLGHAPRAANSYLTRPELNLVSGLVLDDIRADLDDGDGSELKKKFMAPHSSCALAVNSFAPFRKNGTDAPLLGLKGLQVEHFEKKCHHGLSSKRAPNLDLLAKSARKVVGVESKFLEFLSSKDAEFSDIYFSEIVDARRRGRWFAHMETLRQNKRLYSCLDAAQLIKHAYGLANCYPDEDVTLLYLFWEPSNPGVHQVFAEHRKDVADFASAVSGDRIRFAAMSYPELWAKWDALLGAPSWLAGHLKNLRDRYAVAIPA